MPDIERFNRDADNLLLDDNDGGLMLVVLVGGGRAIMDLLSSLGLVDLV